MNFAGIFKKIIRKSFNLFGYDVIRIENNPQKTLLGLSNLQIKTIIDVGANEGQFAKMILKKFPEATLYCFEPLPDAFMKLKTWAEKGMKGRVNVFNFAIGEKEETVENFFHNKHSPSSSFLKTTEICEKYYPFTKSQSKISVKMRTLDGWKNSLSQPFRPEILVKLDVQGYEDRVIKGGLETLKKAKACILEVNLDRLYEEQANFNELCFMLYELGFKYSGNLSQSYANDGHVIFIDAVFVRGKES